MILITPPRNGVYSSFPTFVEHKDEIHIFYREGRKSVYQVHGLFGKVKKIALKKNELLELAYFGKNTDLKAKVVFAGENELDAIAARLEPNLFSLCTRIFVKGKTNKCFVSFSDEPEFKERRPVNIKGVALDAFYGKPFKSPYGYVFPAYGKLKDGLQRPLLLVTDTEKWELLCPLPTKINGNRLNECSVIYHNGLWHAFIREDEPPYGIWWMKSKDLISWSDPRKIVRNAHAPMACEINGEIILSFRFIIKNSVYAVAFAYPLSKGIINIADLYYGNVFDGGYTDIGVVEKRILLLYYWDDGSGSPVIKAQVLAEVMDKAA